MKKTTILALGLIMQIGFSQQLNNPNDQLTIYLEDAVMYELGGDFEEAANTYKKALELEDNATLHLSLGKVYHQMDQTSLAMESFNQALMLDQSNPEIFLSKGHLNADLGNDIAAINDFTAAILLDPNDMTSYMSRAFALSQIGFQDEAYRDFAIAIQIDSEEAKAYYNMAVVSGILSEENKVCNTITDVIAQNNQHADLVGQFFCSL